MFDNLISRKNTNSAKWDEVIKKYGFDDLISLTVADMDFRTAPEVINAMIDASNYGIYGYTNTSKKYVDLTKKWIFNHYGWKIEEDRLVYCPRVIQTISLFIQNYTEKGDKILIQTPLYDPIQSAVRDNERILVENKLLLKNGKYEIDFGDFERKISEGVKIFIAVSPHNPTGRVWREWEIKRIVDICRKYNTLIISDEVHADFVREEDFVSFGKFMGLYKNMVICTSPAKTFNIPGLEISSTIIKDRELRNFFKDLLMKAGIHNPNYFCIPAVEAAYEFGEEWLSFVKAYILRNKRYALDFFDKIEGFKSSESEGTFLIWVCYKDTGLSEEDFEKVMIDSKVIFSIGSDFGEGGKGFFRVNVATPIGVLETALEKFKAYYEDFLEDKNEY